MAKQCNCVRCRAEELVRDCYPKLDDRRVLLVAQEIVKTMRESVAATPQGAHY